MIAKKTNQSKVKMSVRAIVACTSIFISTHSHAFLETMMVSGGFSQSFLGVDLVSKMVVQSALLRQIFHKVIQVRGSGLVCLLMYIDGFH